MTNQGLTQAISRAAQLRDATIAKASKEAPDYTAFDAAASAANHLYSRTVTAAYKRLGA